MEEPCICVRKLTKSFSGRIVVNNLSLSVRKGEVFALLGHNGAGKSTTIDLILGLKSPDNGCAQILGVDAARNRKKVFEQVGNILTYAVLWLLTMISMFSIGLMVASLCRTTKSMNVATSLLYFPMLLFSGASIPTEVFPKWFQMIAKLMPLGIGIDLLKLVSLGCYDGIVIPVITLIAITAICGTIAVKTFRWE